MIAKCKAIAHRSNALEYIFREGKFGRLLALHNLCGETPKEIHEEMKLIGDYNSRCKNKFLRIEIGIAPQDEPRMTFKDLNRLALLFAKQMGLDGHQWVAVTHRDTDNLHIHIIAKEVRSARPHRKAQADPARERAKQHVRSICYALLDEHRGKGLSGHSMFLYELYRSGVTIERMKNKQGKVYGLKFTYRGYSFKASEIGREFGFRTLPKQFEPGNAQKPIISSGHSSIRPTNDSPIAQVAGSAVDVALDTAGSILSEVGEVTTLQAHGADYAEIAWQRCLRNQAVKKEEAGEGDMSIDARPTLFHRLTTRKQNRENRIKSACHSNSHRNIAASNDKCPLFVQIPATPSASLVSRPLPIQCLQPSNFFFFRGVFLNSFLDHQYFRETVENNNQLKMLRKQCRRYVIDVLVGDIDRRMKAMGLFGYRIYPVVEQGGNKVSTDSDPTEIIIEYPSVIETASDYVRPAVKVEISCLSMKEPFEVKEITTLISDTFPHADQDTSAVIPIVLPSRTFLEKAFLLCEEFQKEAPRSLRMSRHLYDLERLMDTEFGMQALADAELYKAIVEHRRKFYHVSYADYDKDYPDQIAFYPPERCLKTWESDYKALQDAFVYGDKLSFRQLLLRIEELQRRFREVEIK